MTLDFFAKTSGTWINVLAVALGTSLGLLLKHRLPVRMQRIITQGVALITLFIGFSMTGSLTQVKAGRVDGVVLGLLTMVLGGLLGEWWQIGAKLESLVAGVLAQALPDPSTDPQILLITGVGGLMILGTGINLLELTQVRVASFLPALGLAPFLYQVAKFVG
ncbi:MAG: DUF554 domain-containing protein [Symplocastrum torsivum CPER-KK1]|jgi:uncharacterized membrane protein YqgA involved in biofilm formation|uniref:DUF554 domain-containing protein n=1 Tax=Symplocastrum torsivum CPER-KK1 TaxID=450513 RepID=A0A951PKJ2_9CYAN|nr:DUF554 domain-containing protein [Symplocastrum torsivum CPER-KK1]